MAPNQQPESWPSYSQPDRLNPNHSPHSMAIPPRTDTAGRMKSKVGIIWSGKSLSGENSADRENAKGFDREFHFSTAQH
jgi:hypothetical protein